MYGHQITDREDAYHCKNLKDKLFTIREKELEDERDFKEIFDVSSELLLINPDFYTAWNCRKEALLRLSHLQTQHQLWKDELVFTIKCLRKNEKSYSVWQHRIWVLTNMPKSEYNEELRLCTLFLEKDERNFHCWDYRNYISELANAKLEDEMEFTTQKIKLNFSNFSAWHRRHKLFLKAAELPQDIRPPSCDFNKKWDDEYEFILKALFTDPSDQSPWKYHQFLVRNNFGKLNNEHLKLLIELQELEPGNKWVENSINLVKDYLSLQAKIADQ